MQDRADRLALLQNYCEAWSQRVWHRGFGDLPVEHRHEVLESLRSAYGHWLGEDSRLAYQIGQYQGQGLSVRK